MDGVNIHYDHAEGRHLLGHQPVTGDLVIGDLSLPIDFKLYIRDEGQAGFKTKQELFRILVKRAADGSFPSICVATNTNIWYFNRKNMICVEELGRDWVAGCKSNRLILMPRGWTQISAYTRAVPRAGSGW